MDQNFLDFTNHLFEKVILESLYGYQAVISFEQFREMFVPPKFFNRKKKDKIYLDWIFDVKKLRNKYRACLNIDNITYVQPSFEMSLHQEVRYQGTIEED